MVLSSLSFTASSDTSFFKHLPPIEYLLVNALCLSGGCSPSIQITLRYSVNLRSRFLQTMALTPKLLVGCLGFYNSHLIEFPQAKILEIDYTLRIMPQLLSLSGTLTLRWLRKVTVSCLVHIYKLLISTECKRRSRSKSLHLRSQRSRNSWATRTTCRLFTTKGPAEQISKKSSSRWRRIPIFSTRSSSLRRKLISSPSGTAIDI